MVHLLEGILYQTRGPELKSPAMTREHHARRKLWHLPSLCLSRLGKVRRELWNCTGRKPWQSPWSPSACHSCPHRQVSPDHSGTLGSDLAAAGLVRK